MTRYVWVVQAIFWFASVCFAAGTYWHTQVTVNEKVKQVEEKSEINSKILCTMAIELKLRDTKNICIRNGF